VWLVIGTAAAWLHRPRRRQWLRATAAVVIAYLLNTLLKVIVGRRRPRLAGLPPLVGTPTGLGFPSSHATTSFLAARWFRRLGLPGLPLYGLACALAGSRVYLGVHYPSDVLAGAALGSVLGRPARGRDGRRHRAGRAT
jgi:undecaprenyl-diphosphatase